MVLVSKEAKDKTAFSLAAKRIRLVRDASHDLFFEMTDQPTGGQSLQVVMKRGK